MSDALGAACLDLGGELFEVVQRMDPARWRDEVRPALARKLELLAERTQQIRARYERHVDREDSRDLMQSLEHLRGVIKSAVRDFRETKGARPDWAAMRGRLTTAYDRFSQTMRARSLALPRNRPTNYMRNVYHVGSGLMLIGLIQYLLTPWTMILVAAFFAVFGWTLELVRWLSPAANRVITVPWKAFIHPDEHWRINSVTWLCTALLIMALCFDPLSCTIGVAVLGLADPAAALVGRRFGRRRLHRNRTLEGTSAFFGAALLASVAVLALYGPELVLWRTLLVATAAALPSAIAELFSNRLDDNLTVPFTASMGAWLAGMALIA